MRTLLLFFALTLNVNAFAQLSDKELFNQAMDNVSQDTLVCSVYLTYVEKAIQRMPKINQQIIDKYKNASARALRLSSQAIDATDQSEEIKAKILKTRMTKIHKTMSAKIGHDLTNMFILFNDYAEECQAWIGDPDTEMLRVIKRTWFDYGAGDKDPTEIFKKLMGR